MHQRKIVSELNNIHQARQFMAFKSCEVIIVQEQHPTTFNFINLQGIKKLQNLEPNYKNALGLN